MQSTSIKTLLDDYRDGRTTPRQVLADIRQRIGASGNPGIWIYLLNDDYLEPLLKRLESSKPESLPLYGVPFAIKDNIDLAGVPTTAACHEFSYTPDESAQVVNRLIAAGALPIGKTNLDQFATGLVGTRSPYPIPINPLAPERVPGGSSSGSAVAVAEGMALFSLGTDTAGSGRVPAAFNNLWGLKPTRGRLSTRGVVPACRTLDCVSIFAHSADDCQRVLEAAEGFDPGDAYSIHTEDHSPSIASVLGIPRQQDLHFFGDARYAEAWRAAIEQLRNAGWELREVDFSPFIEAARLLYEGPWVAERYAALESFIATHPGVLHPVTGTIILGGARPPAAAAFKAAYRLAELRRRTEPLWQTVTALVTPTAGGFPTLSEVAADPIGVNSQLGYYTNFMNLLDLAAVAAPAGTSPAGLPFGITWIAPRGHDHHLLQIASAGPKVMSDPGPGRLRVILFGAHMSGLPLNPSILALGGRLLGPVRTAPLYRMLLLETPAPARPGLVRVGTGNLSVGTGTSVAGEAWSLPVETVGRLLAQIRQPLGLGEVELEDGSRAHGFLCEAAASQTAVDISDYGSWRVFLEQTAQ